MIRKKSLMVDMDDVLVNGGFLYLINQFLGTNYVESDFKNYYMQDVIPEEQKAAFFDFFFTKNQYDHCILNVELVETLRKLSEYYNYTIYPCSSFIYPGYEKESGIIVAHKVPYLMENLPFASPYNYIFTCDKGPEAPLRFYAKLDDKLENLNNAKIKILWNAYHNKHLSEEFLFNLGVHRAETGHDVERILLKKSLQSK